MITMLDIFSGIGGFSLAAKWIWGDDLRIHSFIEIDPFCQKVLAKNFRGVPIHEDIKTYQHDGSAIDLLVGGPPCQPASLAGKRKGTADGRWLWPEALRLVAEIKPMWVIFENPTGILSLERGLVFESLLAEMEDQGYTVQPLIIPACAVDAPHRRDRVWIVANSQNPNSKPNGRQEAGRNIPIYGDAIAANRIFDAANSPGERSGFRQISTDGEAPGWHILDAQWRSINAPDSDKLDGNHAGYGSGAILQQTTTEVRRSAVTDPDYQGLQIEKMLGSDLREKCQTPKQDAWKEPWPSAVRRLCRVAHGLSREVDRAKRIKALGNAVVPQVAYEIMRAIYSLDNP